MTARGVNTTDATPADMDFCVFPVRVAQRRFGAVRKDNISIEQVSSLRALCDFCSHRGRVQVIGAPRRCSL